MLLSLIFTLDRDIAVRLQSIIMLFTWQDLAMRQRELSEQKKYTIGILSGLKRDVRFEKYFIL